MLSSLISINIKEYARILDEHSVSFDYFEILCFLAVFTNQIALLQIYVIKENQIIKCPAQIIMSDVCSIHY